MNIERQFLRVSHSYTDTFEATVNITAADKKPIHRKELVRINWKLQVLHSDILYYIICILLAMSLGIKDIFWFLDLNSIDYHSKTVKPAKVG